jgi:hypothetical protein
LATAMAKVHFASWEQALGPLQSEGPHYRVFS